MPGTAEGNSRTYISSHSADVILSDIRPIKLKLEALNSVNVFIDEFLYNVLKEAHSLFPDNLRAGLLKVLPTSLGKEALLEAEVELRAYWERTGPPAGGQSGGDWDKTFDLQWAFELLRLKCEAYSTLNEYDDEPDAEARLHERIREAGGSPPPTSLLAPAALYLTATLEALCEHILSNVGRVASRDSSRTDATIQDLYTALCEDDSIYGLFKVMKVYDQIEQLSKMPKPRRSKSLSRNEKGFSRTSSPHQEASSFKEANSVPSRSRPNSAMSGSLANNTPSSSANGPRTSFDKSRAMKMFISNSRSSNDRDGENQNDHKRSESVLSENTRQTLAAYDLSESLPFDFEDPALLQEFDDLMKSDSTMKVSLTPDRLKTMEAHKQEKGLRGNRRPAPAANLETNGSPIVPLRANGRRPSLVHVASIIEDEEDLSVFKTTSPPSRTRQFSVSAQPVTPPPANRIRSASAATPLMTPVRKGSGNAVASKPTPSASMAYKPQRRAPPKAYGDSGQFPPKTRVIQHNRESLDLDDVMAGSDDEESEEHIFRPPLPTSINAQSTSLRAQPTPLKSQPPSPKSPLPHAVSSSTRELIDFLAEGPPESPSSNGGQDPDFITESRPNGGPNASAVSVNSKKGTGRLQRMMSKLSIGTSDKSQNRGADDSSKSSPLKPSNQNSSSRAIPNKQSLNSFVLANKPIPPRPPPPSSSSPSLGSSDDPHSPGSRQRRPSAARRAVPVWDEKQFPERTSPVKQRQENVPPLQSPPEMQSTNGYIKNGVSVDESFTDHITRFSQPVKAPRTVEPVPDSDPTKIPVDIETPTPKKIAPKVVPAIPKPPAPPSQLAPPSQFDVREMRRLLATANSADECRLILDMCLAKSGIPVEPSDYPTPDPTPLPSDSRGLYSPLSDTILEQSLVDFLLSGEGYYVMPSVPPRQRPEGSRVTAPTDDTAANTPCDVPAVKRALPLASHIVI